MRYRGGSFLAAKRIYATALLLRAGRTASRSVVRRVFALSVTLCIARHLLTGSMDGKGQFATLCARFLNVVVSSSRISQIQLVQL